MAGDGTRGEGSAGVGLRRNIDSIAKIEAAVMGERSRGERFSRYLIRRVGTPPSVFAHCSVIAAWLAWNLGLLEQERIFDPFPFPLLSTLAAIEAILLGLLILASQNRLQHEADRRSHLELQINLMAERENTRTLHLLDALCRHFGIDNGAGELVDEMKAEIDPEQIAESLKSSMPSEE